MKTRQILIVATIIVALVAVGGALAWAQSMRHQLRNKEVAHANELAARDTTIVRNIRAAGDSQIAVTRRLAYQGEVELEAARVAYGDVMDDSVEIWATSLAQFRIRGDSLEAVIEGLDAEVDEVGTITAQGEFDATDSLGVSVTASVEIPQTLVSPLWMWNVRRAPATISAGIQCENSRAALYLTGPTWLRFDVDSVVQDDEICNPLPSGWKPFEVNVPGIPTIVALLTVGAILGSKFQ